MFRFLRFALPLVVIIFGAFTGFGVLAANKPKPETSTEGAKALTVFANPIERRSIDFRIETEGEVRPRSEISVTPQISGRITYISDRFVDGGYIAKGQTIARLDKADFELALVRAKSVVAAAQQGIAREQAEADLAIKDLEELGISQSSPLARREPQLAEAQASLDSARAQLREAELALERTTITAPFNVRVRERAADIGQFVSPGQSLGTIFAVDSVEVSLPLTDEQLGQLGLPLAFLATRSNPGPEVVFSSAVAGEMRHWTGRITRTAAAVNTQSRLINIFGEVKDPYGRGADNGAPMAPGLFVKAELTGKSLEDVLWAPRAAVRGDDLLYIGVTPEDPDTLTLLKDGTFKVLEGVFGGRPPMFRARQHNKVLSLRKITPLYKDETGVYFKDGAEIGELAIISPVQAAVDGMSLVVREQLEDGTIIQSDSSDQGDLALTSGTLATEAAGSAQ